MLMLADAVEGASRALAEPTPARIESLVHDIAMKRLLDGQFDQCSLTLRELATVEDSLIKSLTAVYHGRIKYPDAAAHGLARLGAQFSRRPARGDSECSPPRINNDQASSRSTKSGCVRRSEMCCESGGIATAEVSVAIVDDPTIHRLNVDFLEHDYPTDVLSFLLERSGDVSKGRLSPAPTRPFATPSSMAGRRPTSFCCTSFTARCI